MAQIPTQNSAGSSASTHSKLSGCNCAFGSNLNATVHPTNTYGLATIGYVDASIQKHNESETPHDFVLSGFITEVNGFKPTRSHSLELSSIVEYSPYGEEISRMNADGTGMVNGSSVRYVNTISMSSDLHDIIENHIKPLELSSVKWEAASNVVTSHSDEWNETYTTVSTSSDNWSSVYSTVSSTSALWNGGGEVKEKAESVYATVSSTSATWDSKQSGLYTESGSPIASGVDELPSENSLNRLVTSRGVATALNGKMDRMFPVYVYQGTSKYKVSIGAVGTGFDFIVTSAESWPISTKYQNVHNTNTSTFAYDSEPYSGKIVANDNCTYSSAYCTMGGVPQTIGEDGTIFIPSVTANIAISGLGISEIRGTYSEEYGMLTLPSDARLDESTHTLHMGAFATSMDNANITLQCDFIKKPFHVTYDLHNVTSTETTTSVAQSASYSTTISPRSGYTMATSSCTMGDVPQPITDGHIDIAQVIGDIVISALATLDSQSRYNKHTGILTFASNVTYNTSNGVLSLDSCNWNQSNGTLTLSGNRDLDTYTITNNLFRCTTDNTAATIEELSSYTANITPSAGFSLTSVNYTMGGVPHTVVGSSISIDSVTGDLVVSATATLASSAIYEKRCRNLILPSDAMFNNGIVSFVDSASWNGTNGVFTVVGCLSSVMYTVTNDIPNCINSNPIEKIEENTAYTATITPTGAYVITGISCTMGGIPQAVTNHTISIPSVTADISITATTDHTLRFVAVEDNSAVELECNVSVGEPASLEYSTDGLNWNSYDIELESVGPTIPLEHAGDYVYFQAGDGGNDTLGTDDQEYYNFVTSGTLTTDGNIQGLLDNTLQRTDAPMFAFRRLFCGCGILKGPSTPATTLGDCCYSCMFENSEIRDASDICAETINTRSCFAMFADSAISAIPNLNSKNVSTGGYKSMFNGCTNIAGCTVVLQASSLGSVCYTDMFSNTNVDGVTSIFMPNLTEGEYVSSVHGTLCSGRNIPITYGK